LLAIDLLIEASMNNHWCFYFL